MSVSCSLFLLFSINSLFNLLGSFLIGFPFTLRSSLSRPSAILYSAFVPPSFTVHSATSHSSFTFYSLLTPAHLLLPQPTWRWRRWWRRSRVSTRKSTATGPCARSTTLSETQVVATSLALAPILLHDLTTEAGQNRHPWSSDIWISSVMCLKKET